MNKEERTPNGVLNPIAAIVDVGLETLVANDVLSRPARGWGTEIARVGSERAKEWAWRRQYKRAWVFLVAITILSSVIWAFFSIIRLGIFPVPIDRRAGRRARDHSRSESSGKLNTVRSAVGDCAGNQFRAKAVVELRRLFQVPVLGWTLCRI